MKRFEVAVCLVTGCSLLLAGCSGKPSRVSQPGYSSGAGAAAIEAYDSDSDGAISGEEFERVGALKAAIGSMDKNKDGRLTAEEIDGRIEEWKTSRIGQMAAFCEVTLDGAPLVNAQIVLDPEPFLGSGLPSGSGTTGESGFAGISGEGGAVGLPCGFYKIRITSPDRQIPARYNTETTLGCEVAQYSHWQSAGAVKLNLKSK